MSGVAWVRTAVLSVLALAAGCGRSSSAGDPAGSYDGGPTAGGGTPLKRSLAVVKTGSGIVRSTPPGIDCAAACSAPFDPATNIVLMAVADAAWAFARWGAASSAPPPGHPLP